MQINVDVDKGMGILRKLSQAIQDLNGQIKTISLILSDTQSFWKDEQGNSYRKSLEDELNALTKIKASLEQFHSDLSAIINHAKRVRGR